MSEKTIKVGDVVAWANVPDGALVRTHDRRCFVRVDSGGWCISVGGELWTAFCGLSKPGSFEAWAWSSHQRATWPEHVTIIALGLTGQESADDLRQLAERFEQARAYADAALAGPDDEDDDTWRERLDALWRVLDVEGVALAERMVNEDAARSLSEGR